MSNKTTPEAEILFREGATVTPEAQAWVRERIGVDAPLPILSLLSTATQADVMSGAPVLDHTAELAAVITALTAKSVVFPAGGIFNIDRLHISNYTVKVWDFGRSVFRQRSNYSSGLGHFLRFTPASSAYGSFDDVVIKGGTFDQNGKAMNGHLFFAPYLRRALIEDVTVIHRNQVDVSISLNFSTGVITAVGHPFVNGDAVALYCIGTGAMPSGIVNSIRYLVAARTANTFELRIAVDGSTPTFPDAGSGLKVMYMGSWAFAIGGQDVRIVRPVVRNGTAVFQDGVHILGGNNVSVESGWSEAGDDAYVVGSEGSDPSQGELSAANIRFINCYAKSTSAFAAKVYVNDASRSVRNVIFAGLNGSAGILRNGAISILDNTGTDCRTATAKIDGVTVRGTRLTVGSPSRTDTQGATAIAVTSARNVTIDADIRVDGFPFADHSVTLSNQVVLRSTVDRASSMPTLASTSSNNYAATIAARPMRNLVPNPEMTGATTGIVGGAAGNMPTNWSALSTTQSGVSRRNIVFAPQDGVQTLGLHYTGTASAQSIWTTNVLNTSVVLGLPASQGQSYRFTILLAQSAQWNQVRCYLKIVERDAGGVFLNQTITEFVPGSTLTRCSISRTLTEATTAQVTATVEFIVENALVANCIVSFASPVFE